MLTTVEGVFRDGHIELCEAPPGVKDACVLVTFLPGIFRIRSGFTSGGKPPHTGLALDLASRAFDGRREAPARRLR